VWFGDAELTTLGAPVPWSPSTIEASDGVGCLAATAIRQEHYILPMTIDNKWRWRIGWKRTWALGAGGPDQGIGTYPTMVQDRRLSIG
jgi:hypothetical protein